MEYIEFFKALESREIIKNVIEQEYNNPLDELIERGAYKHITWDNDW